MATPKTHETLIPEMAGALLALAGGKGHPPQPAGVVYYNLSELLPLLLEELEQQAMATGIDGEHPTKYLDMLEALRDKITDRIKRY